MKQPLFSYITIAFIAPVGVFFCCTNNRDGYSHGLIYIFSRPFYLLENVVIFSTKPTGFFDIRNHIEYWRL